MWVQQRPPPHRTPEQPNEANQASINTDLCSVGTVRCVSIIYCKQPEEIHSCPTCRQSVSGERHSPNRSRADSDPNNTSFTQVPRDKCGHHNARSEVVFLVGPTLVSLCQALAPASDSRDGRGEPALRAGKPRAAPASSRNAFDRFGAKSRFARI